MGLKEKLAKMKKKTNEKPAKAKKAKAAKKTTKKEQPKRQKAIGYNLKKSDENNLTKIFEKISEQFEAAGTELGEFMEGKKVAATRARGAFMDLIKTAKELRVGIQEAKTGMEPIYKS
jgi:hypothetical protein